jgi:hypothetical protein
VYQFAESVGGIRFNAFKRGGIVSAIEPGYVCRDISEFNSLLVEWLSSSMDNTIGSDGQDDFLTVPIGDVACLLRADTTRAGVKAYLTELMQGAKGYSVVPSTKGVVHRIAAGPTTSRIPGFYLYSSMVFEQPRMLIEGGATRERPFTLMDVAVLILKAVSHLHARGFQRLRIYPGLSGSGLHWRTAIAEAGEFDDRARLRFDAPAFRYTTGSEYEVGRFVVGPHTSVETLAEVIWNELPDTGYGRDWAYAGWFLEMLSWVRRNEALPIAYSDMFDGSNGWEIGSVTFELPPAPRRD